MGLDWNLKLKEAKYWWCKEARGAKGVTVGFFRLDKSFDISEDQGVGRSQSFERNDTPNLTMQT